LTADGGDYLSGQAQACQGYKPKHTMTKRKITTKPAEASPKPASPACPFIPDNVRGGGNWAWATYSSCPLATAKEKAEAVATWIGEGRNYKWSCGGRADTWAKDDTNGQQWIVHFHLDNTRHPRTQQANS